MALTAKQQAFVNMISALAIIGMIVIGAAIGGVVVTLVQHTNF